MMTLRQAVVFAILMENNEGILGKAPIYVKEKLISCALSDEPEGLLDSHNLARFREWTIRWKMEVLL